MRTAIIIPARYGSTRFPGKPLAKIGGKSMLERVVNVARKAAEKDPDNISIVVATDDERIAEHCAIIGIHFIMTPESCVTGSDRVLSAMRQMIEWPDFVINLQGDAPFTPPQILISMIEAFTSNRRLEVVTPVHRLSWAELDRLREAKLTSPFSGTTVTLNKQNQALWFSKLILPAIRDEQKLRESSPTSPVYQHIGVYGYRVDMLEKFVELDLGFYEQMEGLEQLRLLENGVRIQAVIVDVKDGLIHSGIDTPEDLKRAEARLKA